MDALQWMIWEDFRKPPRWNSMGLHRHQTIEEIVYDNHPGLVSPNSFVEYSHGATGI